MYAAPQYPESFFQLETRRDQRIRRPDQSRQPYDTLAPEDFRSENFQITLMT